MTCGAGWTCGLNCLYANKVRLSNDKQRCEGRNGAKCPFFHREKHPLCRVSKLDSPFAIRRFPVPFVYLWPLFAYAPLIPFSRFPASPAFPLFRTFCPPIWSLLTLYFRIRCCERHFVYPQSELKRRKHFNVIANLCETKYSLQSLQSLTGNLVKSCLFRCEKGETPLQG